MSDPTTSSPAAELQAMAKLSELLTDLADDQRVRVLGWAANYFGVSVKAAASANAPSGRDGEPAQISSFAELLELAVPGTGPYRVLCAAYWLQTNGAEQVDGASVNSLLKEHGIDVPNVTNSFASLIARSPKLAMQAGKKGKTQKLYRLTTEGRKEVQKIIARRPEVQE